MKKDLKRKVDIGLDRFGAFMDSLIDRFPVFALHFCLAVVVAGLAMIAVDWMLTRLPIGALPAVTFLVVFAAGIGRAVVKAAAWHRRIRVRSYMRPRMGKVMAGFSDFLKRFTIRPHSSDVPDVGLARVGAIDVEIRPAATQEEAQGIRDMIADLVPYPSSVVPPAGLPERSGELHQELVGAWRGGDLVGAAFIGPDEQEADGFAAAGMHDDASVVLGSVAMIHDIAVAPEHRRTGVALALMQWLATWAVQHGAHIIMAIPMIDASRLLCLEAGYGILDPGSTVALRVQATGHSCRYPSTMDTTWAYMLLTDPEQAPLLLGLVNPDDPARTHVLI